MIRIFWNRILALRWRSKEEILKHREKYKKVAFFHGIGGWFFQKIYP